ncbi:hypothetical protein LB504_010785 [Fusarium proliferatum]|nr:hypothetical protein LB504_010785 [Fusarium proliferatum]
MSFLVKIGLIFSIFTTWASCFSKFLRPPERDPDQAVDQDMTKNNHYEDGEMIPILYDTNIKKVDLYIWQFIDAEKNTTARLESNDGTSDSTGWKAQYDISNATENNEDCIYWFSLMDSTYGGTLAKSQFVNVSAPKAEETTTDSSTSISSPTLEPSSKSGLSRGEIAGVAVGATIGGLLVLGGIGWMFWRMRARRKNDGTLAELPGSYNQDQPHSERPKSELPAEPVVFPSERPRSPPRIYEAP